jgi:hypothetical protein
MRQLGIWLLLFQATQTATAPKIPDSPGVYYMQDNGKWGTLTAASGAKTTTKGLDLFVETGGYTNLETDVVCQGARANTRISIPRPTFYVRGVGAAGNAILVEFTQKKERRTFRKSSANVTAENRIGVRKGAVRQTTVTTYPGGIFSVTPEAGLKPGEYLLVLGDAAASYDFGIDRKK